MAVMKIYVKKKMLDNGENKLFSNKVLSRFRDIGENFHNFEFQQNFN